MTARPKHSRCPEGQDFIMGRRSKLVPIHTTVLGSECRCNPCRGKRLAEQWTPERRAERSAAYTGRVMGRTGPRRAKADVWTAQQDDALRSLLGKGDRIWIGEQLTARFPCPRTPEAIQSRIKKLRLSRLAVRPFSRAEVGRALGIGDQLVARWVSSGLLIGIPWHFGGGHQAGHVSQAFTREHIELFLRAHADQVKPERIRDGGFRSLVEGITRGRRPLTVSAAADGLGISEKTLRYWVSQGRVPGAYQIRGRFWRIPTAAMSALRELAILRRAS